MAGRAHSVVVQPVVHFSNNTCKAAGIASAFCLFSAVSNLFRLHMQMPLVSACTCCTTPQGTTRTLHFQCEREPTWQETRRVKVCLLMASPSSSRIVCIPTTSTAKFKSRAMRVMMRHC